MNMVLPENYSQEYQNIQKLIYQYLHSTTEKKLRDAILEDILELYGADRAFLFDLRNDGINIGVHYECCKSGIGPIVYASSELFVKVYKMIIDYQRKHNCYYFDLSNCPIDFTPEIIAFFKDNNIKTLLIIPGIAEGEFDGFLAVDNPSRNLDQLLYLFLAGASMYIELTHEKLRKATNWEMEKLLMARELRLRSIEEAFSNKTQSILRAVTDEFICLIDVNLITDKESRFFLHTEEDDGLPHWSEAEDYNICIIDYANKFIVPEDRQRFIDATYLDTLKKYLATHKEFIIEYEVNIDGDRRRFQGRFTLNNEDPHTPHMYVGIKDVTREYENSLKLIEAQESAKRDPLTGLLNKGAFEDILNSLGDRTDIAIIIMDIDRFKSFNDTYGHSLGDLIIKSVAANIQNTFSAADYVARIGGDEFCVIMTNISRSGKAIVSQRLEALKFHLLKQKTSYPQITLSMGVAFYTPSKAINPQELLNNADAALYQAKNNGRNNYKFFE